MNPYILIKFLNTDKNKEISDPTVSVVVWEWKDSMLLGKPADKPVDEVRDTIWTDMLG